MNIRVPALHAPRGCLQSLAPALSGLLILVGACAAHASVRVESMQMPAWLQRLDDIQPLNPGVALRDGDILRTGEQSRVVLRLEEGSQVKLGENARFTVARVGVEDDQWGLFSALFDVISGAFRFTTGALGAQRRRDVSIRVGLMTAGIRGTDIWGRSTRQQDLVCLIEGKIEVSRGATQVAMETPLSVFTAPRDGDPQPLASVDPAQLAEWAQETELQAGAGVLRENGRWSLQLASFRTLDSARGLASQLRRAGYAVGVSTATVNDGTWHRISVAGFVSDADARAAGARLQEQFNLSPGWVSALP